MNNDCVSYFKKDLRKRKTNMKEEEIGVENRERSREGKCKGGKKRDNPKY